MVATNMALPPYRVVLQARTTSSRLPAKVLLPIAGMPLSVLTARRAARDGADVVVAVPDGPEDRALAQALGKAGLTVRRGPLQDVLQRFLIATEDLPDSAICVRLTSDNPCPDAEFVETVVRQLHETGQRYIAYGNDGQWLPYGMSAEAFYVRDLRRAAEENPDAYTREHVTVTIRRAHAPRIRPALVNWPKDLGGLRCTVDTLEDYLRIVDVFDSIEDPIGISWRALTARLQRGSEPSSAPLILGTVQLGLPYGITREVGLMPEGEAQAILAAATELGCGGLDTARAYGESENRIGQHQSNKGLHLPLVTKLAPLSAAASTHAAQAAQETRDSVEASLAALGQDKLEILLLHRASHLSAAGGAIWQQLGALRDEGRIGKLGVSVQTPDELDEVLASDDVLHVQLPFNPLDWRWNRCISALRSRPDTTVHVRSVFLQGLLSQPDAEQWPEIEQVEGGTILKLLSELVTDLGRSSVADLCIAYVRAFSWVDGIVIGVDSRAQLQELAEYFTKPALTWAEVALVQERLPKVPEQLLNPALWPAKASPSPAPASITPKLTPSEPFVIWRDPAVMASFPSVAKTDEGLLLSFRVAPREPYDFAPGLGHQQHLHPRSSLALAPLAADLTAREMTLFPADLFAADQDPNLCTLPNGNLMMSSFTWRPQAYGSAPHEAPGFFYEKPSGMSAMFWGSFTTQSNDGGKSWENRQYLPALPGYPELIPGKRPWFGGRHRGQVVPTTDGRLLIGTYDRLDNASPFRCFLYESGDGGQSWRFSSALSESDDQKIGFAEPTLHVLENGDILALHRTFGAQNRLATTCSCDQGASWSAPEFHDVIGHPFHVIYLNAEWAVVVYALRAKESAIKARLMNRRTGTFQTEEIELRQGAKTQDIGYPGGIFLPDGRVLVCYYWIDENGTRYIEGVTLTAEV